HTPPTTPYTPSLHDALPIFGHDLVGRVGGAVPVPPRQVDGPVGAEHGGGRLTGLLSRRAGVDGRQPRCRAVVRHRGDHAPVAGAVGRPARGDHHAPGRHDDPVTPWTGLHAEGR